jgi:hypothetical protein
MDKRQHESERRTIEDRAQRREAAGNPGHFYPRPQDVLADDSLTHDEKIEVLDNWLLALEDLGGALGDAHGPGERRNHRQEERDLREDVRAVRSSLDAQ